MKNNSISSLPSTYILSCLDCPYIPNIKITKQYIINIECQNYMKICSKNNDVISKHVYNKMFVEDYLSELRKKFGNNTKKCSLCNIVINIENIYFCSFCNKFLCLNCNNKHNLEKIDHPTLDFYSINKYCCIHKKNNIFYCHNCFKNICQNCKLKECKNHDVINLEDISIDNKDINSIIEEIDKEENNIKNIVKNFEYYINFIHKKLMYFIKLRNDIIELKKNILKTYQDNKFNYNAIMNLKQLKFIYINLNFVEKEDDKNKLLRFQSFINELIILEDTFKNKISKKHFMIFKKPNETKNYIKKLFYLKIRNAGLLIK